MDNGPRRRDTRAANADFVGGNVGVDSRVFRCDRGHRVEENAQAKVDRESCTAARREKRREHNRLESIPPGGAALGQGRRRSFHILPFPPIHTTASMHTARELLFCGDNTLTRVFVVRRRQVGNHASDARSSHQRRTRESRLRCFILAFAERDLLEWFVFFACARKYSWTCCLRTEAGTKRLATQIATGTRLCITPMRLGTRRSPTCSKSAWRIPYVVCLPARSESIKCMHSCSQPPDFMHRLPYIRRSETTKENSRWT